MEELGARKKNQTVAGDRRWTGTAGDEEGRGWSLVDMSPLRFGFASALKTVFGKTQPELRRRGPAQRIESPGRATSLVFLGHSFHLEGYFHLCNSGKTLAI